MRPPSLARALMVVFFSTVLVTASSALEELRSYTEAFQEARVSSHILFDKIQPIIIEVAQQNAREKDTNSSSLMPRNCDVDRHGAPACFDENLLLFTSKTAEHSEVAVRRAAIDLIAGYNVALVELASGRDPREMQARFKEIGGIASTLSMLTGVGAGFSALIGPASVLIGKFAERMQKLHTAALTRKEILEFREIPRALIITLQKEIPIYYRIYHAKALDERRKAYAAKDDTNAEKISENLRQFYSSLAAYYIVLKKSETALESISSSVAQQNSVNPRALSALLQDATGLRNEAKSFWEAIRKVRDAPQ